MKKLLGLLSLILALALAGCGSTMTTGLVFHSEGGFSNESDEISDQIQEKFNNLGDEQVRGVIASESALPPGLKYENKQLVNQSGYQHTIIGWFELKPQLPSMGGAMLQSMTFRHPEFPTGKELKEQAKKATLAAGGNFVYITEIQMIDAEKAGSLKAWAVKLDPKAVKQLKAKRR